MDLKRVCECIFGIGQGIRVRVFKKYSFETIKKELVISLPLQSLREKRIKYLPFSPTLLTNEVPIYKINVPTTRYHFSFQSKAKTDYIKEHQNVLQSPSFCIHTKVTPSH